MLALFRKKRFGQQFIVHYMAPTALVIYSSVRSQAGLFPPNLFKVKKSGITCNLLSITINKNTQLTQSLPKCHLPYPLAYASKITVHTAGPQIMEDKKSLKLQDERRRTKAGHFYPCQPRFCWRRGLCSSLHSSLSQSAQQTLTDSFHILCSKIRSMKYELCLSNSCQIRKMRISLCFGVCAMAA